MSYNTSIGSSSTIENEFTNNQFDIIAQNIAGYSNYTLDIVNNNFTRRKFGISIDGGSNFRIAGNLLEGDLSSLRIINTGYHNLFNQNLIGCNSFKENSGIAAFGNNREVQFLENDFQLTCCFDFYLNETTSPQINGSIRAIQGDINTPAANCFTHPPYSPDIIASSNGVTPFRYYYQGGEPPFGCATEPLTPGVYTKQDVQGAQTGIDCGQFGGLPEGLPNPTLSDLNSRRAALLQLAPYIYTDENALNQYYITLQEKDAILQYLLGQELASGQYTTAEGLLVGEQSKAANWTIFGLRMEREDYIGATSWLNQLAIEDNEDIEFRDVQLINIQRLQNLDSFQLTIEQEAMLNSVAESNSPVRGFARGILGILKDRRFYPDTINLGGGSSSQPGSSYRKAALVNIFPVPANSEISVSWPILHADSGARLLVYDIYGRLQIQEHILPLETDRILKTGQLPDGVYFLIISDDGKPVHKGKFTIQR